ncbi:cobyric acid synthase CobQ [Leptothrix cholodnii SP-6]|uniref:Cobyric acid synthase n=1 Tax=Leptothrix cholodnii (strain ATCC 51168 / LMG 8142 / SP-6) TaxID=395495 RepID=COBQ_LEPCP|nr:cobyric acid synthase [Leptothrix cholodnii]B1Y856.1 RecName: Full=Cobyric acid synthase [Leptothrix cholodnii SP-6]ACB34926.1 cobyric acid synthase CobQ [Leptothrix cholodnii SP-6]
MSDLVRSPARAVMVLGTSSGAGKSWLATALCRWYARQGLKVAPFKAQNMSNNARVVPGLIGADGAQPMGEIGSAQYFQALAARCVPGVMHNPVLLKPEADTRSQVVVLGEVRRDLAEVPWRERSEALWPHARAALQQLMAHNDVVVIEGAGSPAEINLHASDYVNMRTALAAQAACLVITDIDRGGAFAHLYGTHQLLPADERALIRGFVLNRFRGDAALLAPGPEQLQALTGVPTIGVLPMWREHGLPEEDGLYEPGGHTAAPGHAAQRLRIAIVAYPRISNLDEFQPLRNLPGVQLVWARQPADLERADWVILPGSKHSQADLAWLRAQRLDAAIARHAAAGGALLGICGGLQMLGEALIDLHGVEGGFDALGGNGPGLGLLPLVTQFDPHKLLRPTRASFGATHGVWAALAGVAFDGYEIHNGRSIQHPAMASALPALRSTCGDTIGWQNGSVLGVYTHGLFESPAVLQALFGAGCRTLDSVFDGLADFAERHFSLGALAGLLSPKQPPG